RIIVSPGGKSVYVTNDDPSDNIFQYTAGTAGKLSPKSPARVPAGPSPFGIAETADAKSVYVAISGSSHLVQYNVGAGGTLSKKRPAPAAPGTAPYGAAATPP